MHAYSISGTIFFCWQFYHWVLTGSHWHRPGIPTLRRYVASVRNLRAEEKGPKNEALYVQIHQIPRAPLFLDFQRGKGKRTIHWPWALPLCPLSLSLSQSRSHTVPHHSCHRTHMLWGQTQVGRVHQRCWVGHRGRPRHPTAHALPCLSSALQSAIVEQLRQTVMTWEVLATFCSCIPLLQVFPWALKSGHSRSESRGKLCHPRTQSNGKASWG